MKYGYYIRIYLQIYRKPKLKFHLLLLFLYSAFYIILKNIWGCVTNKKKINSRNIVRFWLSLGVAIDLKESSPLLINKKQIKLFFIVPE